MKYNERILRKHFDKLPDVLDGELLKKNDDLARLGMIRRVVNSITYDEMSSKNFDLSEYRISDDDLLIYGESLLTRSYVNESLDPNHYFERSEQLRPIRLERFFS